jgi:hypothetical protein
MLNPRLDHFPLEILWQIDKFLEPSSRHSLSLVNKQIRSALLPVLFKRVKITMRGKRNLKYAVLRFISQECIEQIRQITVQGWIPRKNDTPEIIDATLRSIADESSNTFEARFTPPNRRLYESLESRIKTRKSLRGSKARRISERDDAWDSLASLIAKIPLLADLIFNSADQIPPCILESLHTYHITCRLHLNTFWLRSLMSDPKAKLTAHGMAIIQSPCLYSITTSFAEDSRAGDISFFTGILADIVTHFAPKLEVLHVLGSDFPDWMNILDASGTGPLIAPEEVNKPQPVRVKLKVLSLLYMKSLYFESIDTSHLRSLYIGNAASYEDLTYLADECHFHSLQRLSLKLQIARRGYNLNVHNKVYDAMVMRLFSKLRALKELDIRGAVRLEIFDYILKNMGSILEILCLVSHTVDEGGGPLFGYGEAVYKRIQGVCPRLQYLFFRVGYGPDYVKYVVRDGVFEDYNE